MKTKRTTYRLGLVAVIALFGYLGVSSVLDGKIRVGRVHPSEVSRKESPEQFWVYTGASLLLTSAAVIALAQSFVARETPQSP